MTDDYGYFGKGLEGYAHYMQSFHATHPECGSREGSGIRSGADSNKTSGDPKTFFNLESSERHAVFVILGVAALGWLVFFLRLAGVLPF